MSVVTKILTEESYDPFFKIEFSFETDSSSIKRGYARVERKFPKPEISFDPRTEEKIQQMDRAWLEMELLNAVIDHILKTCVNKSWKGNVILRTA